MLLPVGTTKVYTESDSPLYADGVAPAVQTTVGLLQAARRWGYPLVRTTVMDQSPGFIDSGIWLKTSPVVMCMV